MLKSVSECTEVARANVNSDPRRNSATVKSSFRTKKDSSAPRGAHRVSPLHLGPCMLGASRVPEYCTAQAIHRQQFVVLWFPFPLFLLHLCVTLFQPRVVSLLEPCAKPPFPSSPPCSAAPPLLTAAPRTQRFNGTPQPQNADFLKTKNGNSIICWYSLDRKAWQT